MKGIKLQFLPIFFLNWQCFLSVFLLLVCLFFLSTPPAFAGLKDDKYDGNVFVVYAGNGSLVPPRATLATALKEHKPALLVFYVDDSSDCKEYAIVVSRLQAFYGIATEIIPVNVDTILPTQTYNSTEPGYYYSGSVPQIALFDQSGKLVLNKTGQVPYEEVDARLREVFDLLPSSKSLELKRRSFNELNSELTQ
ncbi:thylakoid membrane photosystem I accumulation factor [Fischerella sp. JS2]|uniref:thylakoid membrane photosystem I accumulation factor n=1 Tax=Fischerella sp. JS2 TaxID=2597771 RepID=UPI0028EFB651|nr:thylakoid membrane photosystem I accumulation factor [Fischerella sp. JS2]